METDWAERDRGERLVETGGQEKARASWRCRFWQVLHRIPIIFIFFWGGGGSGFKHSWEIMWNHVQVLPQFNPICDIFGNFRTTLQTIIYEDRQSDTLPGYVVTASDSSGVEFQIINNELGGCDLRALWCALTSSGNMFQQHTGWFCQTGYFQE